MSITITGKLNKAAHEFQAGESTGFGIRLGVQYFDRETQSKLWTNYEAAIFARAQGQVDFYRSALVAGTVVEVTAEQAKIRTFEGQNGPQHSIELLNAKVGGVFNMQGQGQPQAQPQQQQRAPQQQPQGYQQQPAQQAPQQQPPQQMQDWSDDIPF